MDKRPIGIFDSGLGSLTVVSQLIKKLPLENIVYLGDTARVPYGTRSKEVVEEFSKEDARFLLAKNVKCIVIACNTASALGLSAVKKISKVPVFDAINPTAKRVSAFKGRIGVIGTRGTVGSHAYKNSIKKISPKSKVFEKACPLLVPTIEEGEIKGRFIKMLLKKYLYPLKKEKIETLILGCTHYPIVKKEISGFFGKKVNLIDPAEEIASGLKDFLVRKKMSSPKRGKPKKQYFVTDLTPNFVKVAEMFLGMKMGDSIKKVSL